MWQYIVCFVLPCFKSPSDKTMDNSKGFNSQDYNLSNQTIFCLPKKHVFNFTGNSEESKLGSYFTNRKHHMADDCAFVCVSKPWFHSSTGKAHLSRVLKKQI